MSLSVIPRGNTSSTVGSMACPNPYLSLPCEMIVGSDKPRVHSCSLSGGSCYSILLAFSRISTRSIARCWRHSSTSVSGSSPVLAVIRREYSATSKRQYKDEKERQNPLVCQGLGFYLCPAKRLACMMRMERRMSERRAIDISRTPEERELEKKRS